MLAYASDRANGRNLNIWIQQLAPAGTEVQLTHFEADYKRSLRFRRTAVEIVFHSTENGGGIYTIPTIGGEPTRLVQRVETRAILPDGQWIAYWVGVPG